MAQGNITKEIQYDKIEIVNDWHIQVRKATKIMEEQEDGSKKELTRTFHRYTLQPFVSKIDNNNNKWTHTETDISGEDSSVQAIANAAWSNEVKNKYKTWMESQKLPGEE